MDFVFISEMPRHRPGSRGTADDLEVGNTPSEGGGPDAFTIGTAVKFDSGGRTVRGSVMAFRDGKYLIKAPQYDPDRPYEVPVGKVKLDKDATTKVKVKVEPTYVNLIDLSKSEDDDAEEGKGNYAGTKVESEQANDREQPPLPQAWARQGESGGNGGGFGKDAPTLPSGTNGRDEDAEVRVPSNAAKAFRKETPYGEDHNENDAEIEAVGRTRLRSNAASTPPRGTAR